MTSQQSEWIWQGRSIGWSLADATSHSTNANIAVVLIHGFGANTNHWRFNQPVLARHAPTYAIDLLGFGRSEQPKARLKDEPDLSDSVMYGFDLWGQQVAEFCRDVIKRPVLLVGNSIGGVVALKASDALNRTKSTGAHPPCSGVVLIDCAQRLMDDKQLATQPIWMRWVRPLLKGLVRQRWLSTGLFRNAARPGSFAVFCNRPIQAETTLTISWWNSFTNPLKDLELQKHSEASSTCSTMCLPPSSCPPCQLPLT